MGAISGPCVDSLKGVVMESNLSRRLFLKQCAQFGGTCCVLLAWNRHLLADESPDQKKDQQGEPVDLKQLSYCGIPCVKACALYKATKDNDVKTKKLLYEQWEMKKHEGIEFDPDKIFCYTCKPGDKPKKVGMDKCAVRNCAMANGVESCVQCKHLVACDKDFWKLWPKIHEFAKKTQVQYLAGPGAALIEIKAKQQHS
jgi:hypothetical protein